MGLDERKIGSKRVSNAPPPGAHFHTHLTNTRALFFQIEEIEKRHLRVVRVVIDENGGG